MLRMQLLRKETLGGDDRNRVRKECIMVNAPQPTTTPPYRTEKRGHLHAAESAPVKLCICDTRLLRRMRFS